MNLKKLFEEWKTSAKVHGTTYEFFVNPTRKELRDFEKEEIVDVRFLIDFKEEKIYVWASELLHDDAVKHIGIPKNYYKKKNLYFTESGELENGKIISGFSKSFMKINKYKWLEKYFKV